VRTVFALYAVAIALGVLAGLVVGATG